MRGLPARNPPMGSVAPVRLVIARCSVDYEGRLSDEVWRACRLVVDTIRGKSATLAVNTLKFMPKKGAKIVLKVLDSAIANAYNNFNADVDDLKVTRVEVDPAPMLKRFHARAKGRGTRVLRHSCHIYLTVGD